jgi:hypothetical protein
MDFTLPGYLVPRNMMMMMMMMMDNKKHIKMRNCTDSPLDIKIR